ncbi:MAG TPA: orotidine-5'-phosphate decarboxylase [Nitrospiraceae bacterium]|nr:orotidine-5'-phosphate decarboxylase [Nitrospiraceae bacterium]
MPVPAGEGKIMSKVNARDRLIVALDVPSAEEAESLLDRVGASVSFVKIGLELYTVAGPEIIKRVTERGKRIFLDLKFLDIEETVRRATARVAHMGVDFLTVHANRKALRAAVEGRATATGNQSRLKLLAVTVLTNFDAGDLRDMGIQWNVADLVAARAQLAAEVGFDGVVASGEEPSVIRKKVGQDFCIVTPGIRPTKQGSDEHARVSTPTAAITSGADYLVVGRPIRDATDPRDAAERIISEMQKAFNVREAE